MGTRTKLSLWLAAVGLMLTNVGVRADVCVWRDPEPTMQKIFPPARDYKTVTVKMTPERIAAIEEALGAKLDESEKSEFNFYDIIGVAEGKPQKLGTVMALAGKGEYGAIEVVIGVEDSGKIVGAYIQRSRERATKAIQAAEFLNQFAGKTKDDGLDVGKELKPAASDAEAASRIVAFVVKKMLVFHDVLMKGDSKQGLRQVRIPDRALDAPEA